MRSKGILLKASEEQRAKIRDYVEAHGLVMSQSILSTYMETKVIPWEQKQAFINATQKGEQEHVDHTAQTKTA